VAIIYKEDFVTKLQERLSEPTKWKDFMKVDISDKRELHNPYRTDVSIQTLTRYTAYTSAAVAQTDETVVIDASFLCSEVIDRADLAQSGYVSQMESADHMGVMLNEKIESYIYAQHAQFTDFDNAAIGGAAGNITVSATNIDNIVSAVKREIVEAKGESLMERNGVFIVWRPADFEILTQFMMANGFSTADNALKNGVKGGVDYMGVTHYQSNLLTAGHLFGGVKKVCHLGILRSTYGQIVVDEKDPGLVSGVGITARLDLKVKAWAKTTPVLFDILVA
jgi:hypothetical protein